MSRKANRLSEQPEHATLGSGNLRLAVKLPEGEDLNEWLAVGASDFFSQLNMLYSTLLDFCTEAQCPVMSAGPKFKYMWAGPDGQREQICAPLYVAKVMHYVQQLLDDERTFPTKNDLPFPKNFLSIVKTIFKRLFRVYAHVYHSHFQHIAVLEAVPHLNTSFRHFIFFVQEFGLVDKRELAPLSELIDTFSHKKQKNAKK